jgi:hypothetical protein
VSADLGAAIGSAFIFLCNQCHKTLNFVREVGGEPQNAVTMGIS